MTIKFPLEKSYPDSYIELEISITLDYKDTLVQLRESQGENHIEGGNSDDEHTSVSNESEIRSSQASDQPQSTNTNTHSVNAEAEKFDDEDEEEKDYNFNRGGDGEDGDDGYVPPRETLSHKKKNRPISKDSQESLPISAAPEE